MGVLLLQTTNFVSGPVFIGIISVWVLIMHYLDIYWLVMPVLHHEGMQVHWMDFVCLVGVGSLFQFFVVRRLARHPLIPVGDPRLGESLRLHNDY